MQQLSPSIGVCSSMPTTPGGCVVCITLTEWCGYVVAAVAGCCYRGRGQAAGRGNAAAYIRISEFEIADDYPMPLAYKVRGSLASA
jgi:hypothetical protein